ncbi:MAG: hypothetical protein AAB933_01410 [Patescibacteria group bacterium]
MKDKLVLELIIVLIIAGFGLWSLTKNPPSVVDGVNSNQQAISPSGGAPNTNVPITAITYEQALKIYKDARIQLNQDCQASPNNVTYKNNTYIMLDNRSDKTRAVKLGSSFTIPAYGFKIVKLGSASLPATWYIDCGSSQNVATILIQK